MKYKIERFNEKKNCWDCYYLSINFTDSEEYYFRLKHRYPKSTFRLICILNLD